MTAFSRLASILVLLLLISERVQAQGGGGSVSGSASVQTPSVTVGANNGVIESYVLAAHAVRQRAAKLKVSVSASKPQTVVVFGSDAPRHFERAECISVLFSCNSVSISPTYAQVPEVIAGGASLTGLISGLKGLAKQIEDSGHSLIEHGNAALGQQQVLMASTLNATISQFEQAYKNSLNLTFDKVDVQAQNAYKELDKTVKNADKIRTATVTDAQHLIYQTQGAANQLLAILPLTKRTPVYYGFTTRDILTAAHASPTDIEILGFYLTDSNLNYRKPKITVSGTVIPDDKVDAQFDRVKVQLPDDLRKKLRLENTACEPIKTFPVKIEVFYTNWPRLSKISSWADSAATFSGQASPGAPLYEISADFTGTKTTTTSQPIPFSASGGYTSVGCEETKSGTAQFTAPANATQINPTAVWINADKIGSQSQTVTATGLTAIATGTIRGNNKNIFGDCGGGGHAELIVKGTYNLPVTATDPFFQNSTVTATSESSIVVPSGEGVKLNTISVKFHRKACSGLFDEASFTVPDDDPNRNVHQTSRNGFFNVSYDRGNLTITGTTLLTQQ
jgi:hypothetical protein